MEKAKEGVPTFNEEGMFEFVDLNIGHVYKIVTFLFEFMSGQIHRIHRVSEQIEKKQR